MSLVNRSLAAYIQLSRFAALARVIKIQELREIAAVREREGGEESSFSPRSRFFLYLSFIFFERRAGDKGAFSPGKKTEFFSHGNFELLAPLSLTLFHPGKRGGKRERENRFKHARGREEERVESGSREHSGISALGGPS